MANEEAVSRWFDFLMSGFKYDCLPEYGPLLQDMNIDEAVNNETSEDDLSLLAERLQEHA